MATKKTTTNAALEEATVDVAEEVVNVEPVKEVVETPVKKVAKKYSATDPIECVSITAGELGMIGIKSRINYRWAGRGDVTEIEYQDLVAAIRSSKKHVFQPYFLIQDDEFVAQFPQLKKVYDSMYSISDLKDVFKMTPAAMKKTILSLPDGAKQSIKNIASTMISKGQLDSVAKIKALDEIFDTKFMLMTELFS